MRLDWLLMTWLFLHNRIPKIVTTLALLIAAFVAVMVFEINQASLETQAKVLEIDKVLMQHRHSEVETRGLLANVDRLQAKIAADEEKNRGLLAELRRNQLAEKKKAKKKAKVDNASKDGHSRRWPYF